MRLLFATPFLPDVHAPHGGGIYLGTLSQALTAHAELGLAALVRADEEPNLQSSSLPYVWRGSARLPERPRGLAKRNHQLRMLWRWGAQGMPLLAAKLGTAWPEANAAFIWATIQRLTGARYPIDEDFLAALGIARNILSNRLQRLVEQIAAGVGQVLERRGLIERDIENAWLAAGAAWLNRRWLGLLPTIGVMVVAMALIGTAGRAQPPVARAT